MSAQVGHDLSLDQALRVIRHPALHDDAMLLAACDVVIRCGAGEDVTRAEDLRAVLEFEETCLRAEAGDLHDAGLAFVVVLSAVFTLAFVAYALIRSFL